MATRENRFQSRVIQDLEYLFPGCLILKNDAAYIQGIPDLLILHNDKWACLECKKSINEPYQPNQEYYLGRLRDMSFASMICPENKEDVLYELQRTLAPHRGARVLKS